MGPTRTTVAEMLVYARLFRDRGGSIEMPPHPILRRRTWIVEAKSYREAWDYLPPSQRTYRLREGLTFLWAALHEPRCIVALFRAELVAAMSYDVETEWIEVHVLGSRQLEEAGGAGMAIQVALAHEAQRRGLGVHSSYTADARNWHLRIGRRLDRIPGAALSEWTAEDCESITQGIKEGL
jgi:hypothetical protein